MFNDLIGAQILEVNTDENIIILKDTQGQKRHLVVIEHEGDCGGFNECGLSIFEKEIERNPILTKIEQVDDELVLDGDRCTVTFYSEYTPLVQLESFSSSDSGWGYGAYVSLKCRETNEEYTITHWW